MTGSRRALGLLAVAAAVAVLFAGAAVAAPRGGGVSVSTVASGLLNPRGMTFDFFGNLYVAEGGSGGSLSTEDLVPPPCEAQSLEQTSDAAASVHGSEP